MISKLVASIKPSLAPIKGVGDKNIWGQSKSSLIFELKGSDPFVYSEKVSK